VIEKGHETNEQWMMCPDFVCFTVFSRVCTPPPHPSLSIGPWTDSVLDYITNTYNVTLGEKCVTPMIVDDDDEFLCRAR
jgi:hypothetical protein